MGAAYHFRVVAQGHRAVERALNAGLDQFVRHLPRAVDAAVAYRLQAGGQRRLFRVYAQADDVHGVLAPADRDFDAVEEGQAPPRRLGPRRGQAVGAVVVGQRHQGGFALGGARDHLLRRQGAVGGVGMKVQIDAGHAHCPFAAAWRAASRNSQAASLARYSVISAL